MKILIAGDILPQDSNQELFEQGKSSELIGDRLLKRFAEADFRICNLEGPLTDTDKAIAKSGPCIKAGAAAVQGLKQIGFDCAALANNHIMDYGVEGYEATLRALDAAGIGHMGAGENALAARKPLIVTVNGLKVGIYACAEYEFTIATDRTPGANAFDALYCLDDISDLKKQVDYLIVLYHGLRECYRYPVPYVQKRCRRMVEKGADLVLCQHSHCIGCVENRDNGQILYGQGNFLFDRVDDEYTQTGLLVEIEYSGGGWNVAYVPVVKTGGTVREAEGDKREKILSDFRQRSEQIRQDGFVEEEYRKYAERYVTEYYDEFLGRLKIVSRWLKKLKYKDVYGFIFRKGNKLNMLNALRCEAHRDLFIRGLENELGTE